MFVQNDPFRQFESMFEQFAPRRTSTSATMPMDAYRRDGNVWVHIDLPGVSTDSIDINVERDVLTVSASRGWTPEDGDKPYLNERRTGTFRRQIHLGEGLDTESIEADYHDGVLTLRVPVAEKAKPKKIAINTSSVADALEPAEVTEPADA